MSVRPWRARVQDILDSLARIHQYTAGMTEAAFMADAKTVDAVMHHLIIIGEAARHVSPAIRKRSPDIPWQMMAGLRNHAVHAYWGIVAKVIWDTIYHDLPTVEAPLRALLASADNELH